MNMIDVNLDIMNLVKDIPEDCAVFYFLTGQNEEEDFLFCKGSLEDMSEALVNLMSQHDDIEWLVKTAVKEFQDEKDIGIADRDD